MVSVANGVVSKRNVSDRLNSIDGGQFLLANFVYLSGIKENSNGT